jgi:hypothetical protein
MRLERFQQSTVEAAVAVLRDGSGSRRFLVADEVGLGKTIVSREVARGLRQDVRGPLNVAYLCPNLDIASQNLTKLLALEPNWKEPADRLSLICRNAPHFPVRDPAKPLPRDFRLFSFTPETSLPGWKASQRTGRASERDLIGSLTAERMPALWRLLRTADDARLVRPLLPPSPAAPPPQLVSPYELALRQVFALRGRPLEAGLMAWFAARPDVAEFILRARAALALAALSAPATRPHLLILDEFHRYADLILPSGQPPKTSLEAERRRVHRLLVGALLHGPDRPALLLMSATPYRLQRADGGDLAEGDLYANFIRLVRFLYGEEGAAQAGQAEQRIRAHHAALRNRTDRDGALQAVRAAKKDLEQVLRPVIARTERATSVVGELFDRRSYPAPVQAEDLRIFQHFAKAVDRHTPHMRSWVTPLWASVPYPAETLFEYKVSRALEHGLPEDTSQSAGGGVAHPQFRSLLKDGENHRKAVDPDRLGLPWAVPTIRWWRLGGRWATAERLDPDHGKALIFSRYRASPAAISALLSMDVDRRGSRKMKGKGKFSAQAFLRVEDKSPGPLLALFMPWPILSAAINPGRDAGQTPAMVRRRAAGTLEAWFTKRNSKIVQPREGCRKPWRLALEAEAWAEGGKTVSAMVRAVIGADAARRASAAITGLGSISRQEIALLADWLLSAPGAVIARSLQRHTPGQAFDKDPAIRAFRFCWSHLRPYLGQRYFAGAILGARPRKGRGGFPEALRTAIVEGGFEAVIDEHLAVMTLIGDSAPIEVLEASLLGRPGQVRLRKASGSRRARVHAAVPFVGAERRSARKGKEEKLRSESLRRAFNSPFWPHVLSTTSIGQEGLDFHVWCDRIVHWDLPNGSVDFEQREGRIARYASLSVRRALAAEFAAGAVQGGYMTSPFQQVLDQARATPSPGIGLERWWSPPGRLPISVTFDMPFSLASSRLGRLQRDLVHYRLALGQPEPALFNEMMTHFALSPEESRSLALNLSAAGTDERP